MNEIIKRVGTGIAKPTPIEDPVQEFMANATGKRTVTITDELGVTLTMDITGYFEIGRNISYYHDEPCVCSFECDNPILTYPKGVQPINGTND